MLTLNWDVPPYCPLAQPVLPLSHQPRQNQADGGTSHIKVNPTEVCQEMGLPVVSKTNVGGEKLCQSVAVLVGQFLLLHSLVLYDNGGPKVHKVHTIVRPVCHCYQTNLLARSLRGLPYMTSAKVSDF